ncbi:MAG: hypothetical protein O3B25_10605, partial [Verrucomicrobia bacterium]|nr:hypothetical protein [Verrucomicrobiota bacterium]
MNRNTLIHRSVFFTVIALALSTCGTAFAQKTADDDPIEMVSRRLRLSYVDPTRCTQLLKLYGITIGSVTAAVDPKKLPVVVALPETKFHEIVPASSGTFPRTETDPLSELMVFYDSSEPSQFGRIVRVVREQIDIPARKIMIEAMVLEISSTALKELGVQWDLTGNAGDGNFVSRHLGKAPLTIGKIRELVPSAKNVPQLDFSVTNAFREFNFRLQALVKEGSAEVLSRPSVLTLDNRMAYINVSEKIPIATTKFAKDFISAVDFREVTAGIELAVRPRINEDGSEVSIQINASVSARVPGENNEVKDKDGNLLATAPTLSIREVKTYARIANDTPFIIGGLIAKDSAETVHSVPILGKIPILGALFRSKSKTGLKREVIIVITPSVLPEENLVNKSMPKDEDLFDSFDHRLFRDAYRIRDEDTFDLRYLTENRGLLKLQAIADRIVTDDVRLAEAYPYNRFADRAVPGEDALVRRQIYEVLKHREAAEKLDARKLIFFRKDEDLGTGFRVRFLSEHLQEVAPFVLSNKKTGKAFALRYQFRRDRASASELLEEPVPEMAIVDCPDKATWRRLLWELNQPGPKGEV